MREFRAFLLSPMPAALFGALVSWASDGHPRPASVAVFYLISLYAAQLLLGIAIRAYLFKRGHRSAASLTLGGTLMMAIPTIPYMVWAITMKPASAATGLVVLVIWLLLGSLTGLTYWWLTRPAPERAAD